jgi:hypothetical protein
MEQKKLKSLSLLENDTMIRIQHGTITQIHENHLDTVFT